MKIIVRKVAVGLAFSATFLTIIYTYKAVEEGGWFVFGW